MQKLKSLVENQAFGVCTRLGEKMGVSISSIRLFFIYTSFITLGSPVIIYMSLAFVLNMRKHLRRSNHPTIWDI